MDTATRMASQVRTGRQRAIDGVVSALGRAETSHDQLNAFTLIDPSGARHRAEAIDQLVAVGKDPGPLAGVPVAIKDIIDDAGMPNSRGSSFPTELARASATCIRGLGAAGAVIIGRTGLHEFAFGFTSENPWFGAVRNPWDPSTSAGGSSGGSGAAVAAGVVPIAIGTDTGGSVRVPAAMCGVMGLKVTHGRISLDGVFPLVASLDTVGPIARTVDDLDAAYRAMAGDDPADPWSQPRPVEAPVPRDPSDLRIGLVRQWMSAPMAADIRDGIDTFVEACRGIGATVAEVDAPALATIPEVATAIGPEIIAVHGARYASHPERYGRDVGERIEASRGVDAATVMAAERWGSRARATIDRLCAESHDVLIGPTVGALTKTIGDPDVDIDGERIFHRVALASFTAPINRMRVPALAAPVAGTARQGVSMQLVGPMWSEARLLGVARALEDAGVFGVRRPPIFFN
mgnify:CR=1 FL=1